MRIFALTLFLCLQAGSGWADDLSPWFGSPDQKPFRLDLNTTDIATKDIVPDEITVTNSTTPPPCRIAGCLIEGKTANTTEGQPGLSQN